MSDRCKALITGASSGIGESYARILASQCDELILVARRQERLNTLADSLRTDTTEVTVIVADLTTTIGQGQLVDEIRQRGPLSYLINNAGFSTLGPFSDADPVKERQMISLHIDASLALTRAALTGMQEQNRGNVINVASMVGLMPMGGLAVYGATKAFLQNYSEALAFEVKDSAINIQCLCPGYTRTEFQTTEEFTDFNPESVPQEYWMDADEVVRESLAHLASGPTTYVPGASNQAMLASYRQRKG